MDIRINYNLKMVNSAVINNIAQTSFIHIPRSEIVGSKGKCICNSDAVRSNEQCHQIVLPEVESDLLPASVRIPAPHSLAS